MSQFGKSQDSEPLVGMSLMEGYQLMVQVFEGGRCRTQQSKHDLTSRCIPTVSSCFIDRRGIIAAGERERYTQYLGGIKQWS
jgi:hypothetical protein